MLLKIWDQFIKWIKPKPKLILSSMATSMIRNDINSIASDIVINLMIKQHKERNRTADNCATLSVTERTREIIECFQISYYLSEQNNDQQLMTLSKERLIALNAWRR